MPGSVERWHGRACGQCRNPARLPHGLTKQCKDFVAAGNLFILMHKKAGEFDLEP
jgi:hypothetical protein